MSKRIWFAALVLALGSWFFHSASSPHSTGNSTGTDEASHLPSNLVDRIWISDIPETPTQKIDVFLMISHPGFGQFLTSSVYEGDYAVFQWKQAKGKAEIEFPQTNKKHKLTVKVKDAGCAPFDLCMTVKGAPRGAARYVSMEEWVIDATDANQENSFFQARIQSFVSALSSH